MKNVETWRCENTSDRERELKSTKYMSGYHEIIHSIRIKDQYQSYIVP
jgi:hypothetical protein